MSEAPVATPPKAAGVTRMEAVRQALEKLGKDAMRVELQSYIKKQFGFEMGLDHITNCKSELKSKTKAKKPGAPQAKAAAPKVAAQPAAPKAPAAKAAPKPASKKPAAPKAAPNGKSTEGISLDDIQSVKGLVGRVGPDQLRGLVDLLAK